MSIEAYIFVKQKTWGVGRVEELRLLVLYQLLLQARMYDKAEYVKGSLQKKPMSMCDELLECGGVERAALQLFFF